MDGTVRYSYRLRPGGQVERALTAEWGRCRWLWNEADHHPKDTDRPTDTDVPHGTALVLTTSDIRSPPLGVAGRVRSEPEILCLQARGSVKS